jgi:Undecaprenyl-phosphate galactose phosphotransferase WbaP
MLATATYLSASVVGFYVEGFLISLPAFFVPLIVGFLFVNTVVGLYPGVGLHPIVEFRQTCLASTLLFGVFGAALQFSSHQVDDYYFLFGSWCLCLVMAPLVRSVARNLVCRFRWWGQPVILFGNGPRALKICNSLQANRALGLRPVGLVDDSYTNANVDATKPEYLSREQASSAVQHHCVFWAIVTMSDRSRKDIFRVIEEVFLERYPHLIIVPDMTRLPSLWNHAHDCGGMPGIQLAERLLLPLPRWVKRAMDLSFATVGGLLVLPLVGLICLFIRISSPGPIFYSQRRLGFGAHHFHAWKFRTMVANADTVLHEHLEANIQLREEWARDHKLKNDPRVTWVGKWLRKTSLDELPQIWNVLRGQMSLVGPRPIVDAEVEKYGETFERYRKVVPGITGLWQISGRNNTTYQERVDLDSYYVRNWSPWLDLYILIRTIKVVLLREGAY